MDAWYKPVVETGLTEPRWVRAIEMRPSTIKGRKITHHALAYLLQDEKEAAALLSSPDADTGAGLFMEWAVNKQGEMMRPNTGKLMLPGSKIRWDIHYSAAGEDVTDDVAARHLLLSEGPDAEVPHRAVALQRRPGGNRALDIAPNTISVTQNFHVMRRAGRVENFQPHMHLRGKAQMLEAILPNGQQQVLGHVNRFEFNWMNNYVFDDDYAPLLPKGTILKVTSWHDNTAANKNNPDPNQWVGWGDRTVDEMAHAWINITYMSDDDFTKEVDARKAEDGDHDRSPAAVSDIDRFRIRRGAAVGAPSVCRGVLSMNVRSSTARGASRPRLAIAALSGERGVYAQQAARHGAAQGCRSERLSGVRRLVPERRRHLHAADRLLQPQQEADSRHARSARRTGLNRAVPTRASPRISSSAAAGAPSRSRCRRISATRS